MALPQRVILVTGANRGLGYAVLQALAYAEQSSASPFRNANTDTASVAEQSPSPASHVAVADDAAAASTKNGVSNATTLLILAARSATSLAPAISSLRSSGVTLPIEGLELDVSDDASISAAVGHVSSVAGHVDILVNNAGVATLPQPTDTPSKTREIYASTMDVNVAGVAAVCTAFAPLLRNAPRPALVVNMSSGRASLARAAGDGLPPTASIPYSVSKAALNMLSIELAKALGLAVVSVNPGHCKTAFNGFRGKREALEGARVVVEVVKQDITEGFWEIKEDGGDISRAQW